MEMHAGTGSERMLVPRTLAMTHPSLKATSRRADVVIPVYADVALTRACIESVLQCSGEALGRLILVDDCGPDAAMRPMLRGFRASDSRVRLLENETNLGFVGTANRGLALCEGHAAVLNSDARVTEGWLAEMLRVLESSERIAAVSPLSNNGTLCSVPEFGESGPEEAVAGITGSLATLPSWTELPTGNGFCLLMRSTALAALGLFDPAYGRGYNEENDWCQRARALGFVVARANRAFVFHRGEVSFSGARKLLDLRNSQRLVARYPRYLAENRAFAEGPEAHLAASAARARLGILRLAIHAGLWRMVGGDALVPLLRADPRFASVARQGEGPADLLLAPLHHETEADARAALEGNGRLVTVVDAWRGSAHGWQRHLQHLQLRSSDAVIVPSARVGGWVREQLPGARLFVLAWPTEATDLAPPKGHDDPARRWVVAWEPSPVLRVLMNEALEFSGESLELAILTRDTSSEGRRRVLRDARALVDAGGTPAGLLSEAARARTAVITALLGAGADETPFDAARPGAHWLAEQFARRGGPQVRVPPPPEDLALGAAWSDALVAVAEAPDGQVATLRAALQAL